MSACSGTLHEPLSHVSHIGVAERGVWCRHGRTRRSFQSVRVGRRCTRSGRAFPRIRSCLSTRQWSPQVKVRGGKLEAHAEEELIGLADELGEWLCAAAAAASFDCRRRAFLSVSVRPSMHARTGPCTYMRLCVQTHTRVAHMRM
jgi:hypothetical protein